MKKRKLAKHWNWLLYALVFTIVFALSPGAEAIQRILNERNHNIIAINIDGDVFTWGRSQGATPQFINSIANIIDVAVGGGTYYALDADGNVWAWGDNGFGQLGIGSQTDNWTPQLINSLSNIIDIESYGLFALALDSEGNLWSWGRNEHGQLGINSTDMQTSPVQVTALSNVKEIAAGGYHSVALLSNGTVKAWGWNVDGQVGDDTSYQRLLPVTVKDEYGYDLTNVKAISSSSKHSFAVKADGTVWGWGLNDYGQIGNVATSNHHVAFEVPGLYNATAVYPGTRSAIAKLYDGTVMVWGSNVYGQHGMGNSDSGVHSIPILVNTISDVVNIYQGGWNNYVEKIDGTFWGWGSNLYDELGITNASSPQTVPAQMNFYRLY